MKAREDIQGLVRAWWPGEEHADWRRLANTEIGKVFAKRYNQPITDDLASLVTLRLHDKAIQARRLARAIKARQKNDREKPIVSARQKIEEKRARVDAALLVHETKKARRKALKLKARDKPAD